MLESDTQIHISYDSGSCDIFLSGNWNVQRFITDPVFVHNKFEVGSGGPQES